MSSTPEQKVIRAGLGYTIGNILIKGISFLSIPIFTRMMSSSSYGIFNTYMAYEAIVSVFLGVGMSASIKNAKYDFPGKINIYVSTCIRITLYVLIGMLGVVFVFQKHITSFTGFSLGIVVLLVFQSYGSAAVSIYNSKLSIDYRYKEFLICAFFNTVLNIGLSIFLIQVVYPNERELGRMIGAALPLITLGAFIVLNENCKTKFSYDKQMAKYALAFGLPMVWHYLSQTIQSQIDRIMISRMIDNSSTGIYSFAYSIAVIFQVIYYSTQNAWTVWFYEQMDKHNYDTIRKALKKYMLLISALAALMLIGSKEFIMIMSDKSYWVGTNVFIPCLLGIYMLFLYTIPVGVEYYYKKTKYIATMTSIGACVNILANSILIQTSGYYGAAFATMISYAVTFFGHWFIAKKLTKERDNIVLFKMNYFLTPFLFICVVGVAVYCLNPYPLIKYLIAVVAFSLLIKKNNTDILAMIDLILKKQ